MQFHPYALFGRGAAGQGKARQGVALRGMAWLGKARIFNRRKGDDKWQKQEAKRGPEM